MVPLLGPVIMWPCFAFSLHLSPSSDPSGWGLLKGWEVLVRGTSESSRAVPLLSSWQRLPSLVFFLLYAFPSSWEVYIPHDRNDSSGTKNDVDRTPAPEPKWQRRNTASLAPLLPASLHQVALSDFLILKFSKLCSVCSLPSPGWLWFPQCG